MIDEKVSILLKIIDRYDGYINSTNYKATAILALNTFILGTLAAHHKTLTSGWEPSMEHTAIVLVIIILISALVSILLSLTAVYPYFGRRSNKGTNRKSLFFFRSEENISATHLASAVGNTKTSDLVFDLSTQAVDLASGLSRKMAYLRASMIALGIQLLTITILMLQ